MKKLLVISTAYPRYKGDFYAIFIKELMENLKNFNITILAPDDPLVKKDLNNVKRFHYFYPKNLQNEDRFDWIFTLKLLELFKQRQGLLKT